MRQLKKPLNFKGAKRLRAHLLSSNMSQKQYEANVRTAQSYIRKGDIIQVVPSQRLMRRTDALPFDIYRALRQINPSPHMFYLQLGSFELVGSSPEVLVRKQGDQAETRPIAGTAPRASDPKREDIVARNLLADPKERAEHIMLVDLGRNDLGRVCMPASVKVPTLMCIEKYSHVMHIVSYVTGTLRPGTGPFELFRACFPAGTLSGAPKIRAMEIIDELERESRCTYGGSVGYFSYSGNMDMAITIRTMLLKDKTAFVQAGGGVVADSKPAKEYRESRNKAAALFAAIDKAEEGL
jgi:anthranilate synthase component 1